MTTIAATIHILMYVTWSQTGFDRLAQGGRGKSTGEGREPASSQGQHRRGAGCSTSAAPKCGAQAVP